VNVIRRPFKPIWQIFPSPSCYKSPIANPPILRKFLTRSLSNTRGTADVIFAGFPCQGVSRAGKKQATDPRNQMFQQFVRATRIVRPRFIIGENVTGLEKMKSGPEVGGPKAWEPKP
jgi:site-specific DNA-cytosine methylase